MNEILKCNDCGREAHNLAMENKTCSFRLISGQTCQGTLIKQILEPVPEDPYLVCDTCGRRADLMSLKRKTCGFRLFNGEHCRGTLNEAE
jgi:hypothetical protein